MGPAIPSSPDINLMEQINKDFGSFEIFKEQFTESSKVVEASGWNLLVWVPRFNKLEHNTVRKTPRFNTMELQTYFGIRYVGTFIFFTIQGKQRRVY